MNIIIRPGNPKELPVFNCDLCGCKYATDEFTTDIEELTDTQIVTRISTCPCCGNEVEISNQTY